MYFIPNHVSYYEQDKDIYVFSKLYRNKVRITSPDLQEEFRQLVQRGGSADLTTPLTQFLHEQELLINEEELNQVLSQVSHMVENTLFVTIMPTEGCNFRCPYCYEDHIAQSMDRHMLDQIKAYLTQEAPHFHIVQLSWFGGEPTLCKDTVIEISALMCQLRDIHGYELVSSMTTNGYLLDVESFLQYWNVGITNYQITLDGWSHDKTRPHVSGKGTLNVIIRNLLQLSTLSREEFPFHITLRHNILADDEDYSWYDYMYRLFGTDDRFSLLVHAVGDWGGESVKSLKLLGKEREDTLIEKHIDYIEGLGMQCENRKDGLLSMTCYASYPHSMVFRPNGLIEKCTVLLGHPKNRLGILDPKKGVLLNEGINRLWSGDSLKPECYTCSDLFSCFHMRCRAGMITTGVETACKSARPFAQVIKESMRG